MSTRTSSTPPIIILALYEAYLAHYRKGIGAMVGEGSIRYLTQRCDTIRQFAREQQLTQCSPAEFAAQTDALQRWLREERGYAASTVNNYLRELTRVLEWGRLRALDTTTQEVAAVQPPALACLTDNELAWLRDLQLPSAHLRRVRDFFLLQCWTGLSYADLWALDETSVDWTFGQRCLWVKRKKTPAYPKTRCRIPLLPAAEPLLLRYYRPLPLPISRSYHRSLQHLATLSGITRLELTAQVGRDTAGVHLLHAGISIEHVSRLLEHEQARHTQQLYQGLVDERLLQLAPPPKSAKAPAPPSQHPLDRLQVHLRFLPHTFGGKQTAQLCQQWGVDDPCELGQLRVTLAVQGRDTVHFHAGLRTARACWNEDEQRATGPGSTALNQEVAALIHLLHALYLDLVGRKQLVTAGAVHRAFKAKQAGETASSIAPATTHTLSSTGSSYSQLVRAVRRA